MHRVVALALERVVAFDLSIPAQVFGRPDPDLGADGYTFAVCAARPGPVATTTGFDIVAPFGLEALEQADTVVVPGFDPEPQRLADGVAGALGAAHARGARLVSVCTGAFALAEAGLLDGRRAATHWGDAAELARRYPAVEVDDRVLYVDHGDVATSAGVAAGIDLCLHLVRQDHGVGVATAIARRMVVAPYREGSQAQFVDRPLPEPSGGLAPTRAWALERLARPLTVAEMAAHAGWSVRSFARRFRAETATTPLRWLHEQRVAEALRLLEQSDLAVDAVAARAGFGTAASLRLHLRRAAGTTPTAHRRAFTRARPAATPGRAGRPAAAAASPGPPAGHARARRTPRTPLAPG
jgi:transcriptional regulator GlxA family with amidase domain